MKISSFFVKVKNIYNFIKNNLTFILFCLVIILFIAFSLSVKQCTNNEHKYKSNITALTDSIHKTITKTGDTIVYKQGFEINTVEELKQLNPNLYNELIDMGMKKNSTTSGAYFAGNIDMGSHDTTYIVKTDTIYKGFTKEFDFSNEWRKLNGNVSYKPDSLSVNINNDKVIFDYTLAINEDNVVYIKSNNPYVSYNEMTGFQVPKNTIKKWSLGVGPQLGIGYEFTNKKLSPYVGIGISVNYNILSW